jgi:hypothetical protein
MEKNNLPTFKTRKERKQKFWFFRVLSANTVIQHRLEGAVSPLEKRAL